MRLLAQILGLLWMACGLESAPPQRFVFVEKQMGADFRIVLYTKEAKFAQAAAKAAFGEVVRLNAIFSDYEADSELSLLSVSSGEGKKCPVSEDLWTVLAASQRLSTQTDGAFDITVGPCVRLWRIARFRKTLPTADKIARARKSMGYRKILLSPKAQKVQLKGPNMILDLGGIAKGYAADKMLDILKEKGMQSALVDAGGDLALGDAPPDKKGWRIEIGGRKHPDLPVLELANCAVATSGDIEQFVEVDGKRYSHIIDPRTGIGLTKRLQVTVVAPNGMQADSLASALAVLGSEEGALLVKKLTGVESYFIQRKEKDTILKIAKSD
jgi:FAD:protein FMN transferase